MISVKLAMNKLLLVLEVIKYHHNSVTMKSCHQELSGLETWAFQTNLPKSLILMSSKQLYNR